MPSLYNYYQTEQPPCDHQDDKPDARPCAVTIPDEKQYAGMLISPSEIANILIAEKI